jgi:hypothetical protein
MIKKLRNQLCAPKWGQEGENVYFKRNCLYQEMNTFTLYNQRKSKRSWVSSCMLRVVADTVHVHYRYLDLTVWGTVADCGQYCIATSPLFFCVVWTEHTPLGLIKLKSRTSSLSATIRGDNFVSRLDMYQVMAANALSALSYTSHDSD